MKTISDHAAKQMALGVGAGFSLEQLIALLIQYGPQAITIALAVAAAVKSANPVAALEALAVQYGPTVYAIAVTVAGWFGVALPPLPVA
jgi:hypothetical protein